jgi:hypothetical protein
MLDTSILGAGLNSTTAKDNVASCCRLVILACKPDLHLNINIYIL